MRISDWSSDVCPSDLARPRRLCPAGDLYVVVNVREHAIFQRDGKHLYCEVPISFADAALGGELEVPTLDGRVKLKIPEGTRPANSYPFGARGVGRCAWVAVGIGRASCRGEGGRASLKLWVVE